MTPTQMATVITSNISGLGIAMLALLGVFIGIGLGLLIADWAIGKMKGNTFWV